jgi:T5SS/PEP-CTERM-associated repeat protein
VTGAGSVWNGSVIVGDQGSGTLNTEAGGQVIGSSVLVGGTDSRGIGRATVKGAGSQWNVGMINIGYAGQGTLTVQGGGHVATSSDSYIGQWAGSVGTVTVAGDGSSWTIQGFLNVAYQGSGTLNIQSGGQVHLGSHDYYIGAEPGSNGIVNLAGAGSTLTCSGELYVGSGGNGTLKVGPGTKVTAGTLAVGPKAVIQVDVSGNDMLVLGTADAAGVIYNDHHLNLYANAFLPAGAYKAISDCSGRPIGWNGTGSYRGCGGTWNYSTHTFNVPAPVALAAGAAHAPVQGERVLITDAGSGKQVGASFGTFTSCTKFSATPMGGSELDALKAVAGLQGSVRSAWAFDTDLSGGEALLSFDIGRDMQDLAIWRYSGGAWSPYATDLFTYDDNGRADFNVTSFSGYAVTATPEPATLTLLGLGGLAVLRRRRAA